MKRVLIPTDFSENAFNALKYACQIFKYERSEFLIFHAYADEVYDKSIKSKRTFLEDLKATTAQYVEAQLNTLLHNVKHYSPNPKHKYRTVAVFGGLVDEVNQWVNKENIDIVVMGTRGKTNDRSLTFGSNTIQVLRYVHCSVLAIPEGYENKVPRKILFPTNFMVPYKRRELKLLGEMSGSFRSTIRFLYIDPVKTLSHRQTDNKRFLEGCLSKPKLLFKTTDTKDKEVAITSYIADNEIDLLVMVNTRHSYLENMLHQSTVDKIGLHLKIPFLVLQNIAR